MISQNKLKDIHLLGDNSRTEFISRSLDISKIYKGSKVVVYYDVTRLISRRNTPFATGIDRVDLEYIKQHISCPKVNLNCIALIDNEVQLIELSVINQYLQNLSKAWSGDKLKESAGEVLRINGNLPSSRLDRIKLKYLGNLKIDRNIFQKNREGIPYYFNASHIGILSLNRRVFEHFMNQFDGRFITFIHDLIPLCNMTLSTKTAFRKLGNYLNNSLEVGGIRIFNSIYTSNQFHKYFRIKYDRENTFIQYPHIAKWGNGIIRSSINQISNTSYFITVGTIEARKNHLMLLEIFNELNEKHNLSELKLIIIGKRGWKNSYTLSLLDEIKSKSNFIIEINDANDAEVKLLEKNAKALLFPSIEEGFNLPLCDSLNLPSFKLVSDIKVHREIAKEFGNKNLKFIDIIKDDWKKEIMKLASIEKKYDRAFIPDCAAILPFGHNAKAVKYFSKYFENIAAEVKPLVCEDIAEDFVKFDEDDKQLPYLYSRSMIRSFMGPSFSIFNLNPANSIITRKFRKYIYRFFKYDIFEFIALRIYKRLFKKYNVGSKDIFFFHSASYYSIFSILNILKSTNIEKWPTVHLRLINVLENANVNQSGYSKFLKLLSEVSRKQPGCYRKLSVSTETPRYTQKIITDSNYPAFILPYPSISSPLKCEAKTDNYFSVGFLGSGREDKGFFRILNIIKIFVDKYNYHSVKFLVQSIELKTIQKDYNKMHYTSQLAPIHMLNYLIVALMMMRWTEMLINVIYYVCLMIQMFIVTEDQQC